MQPARALLYVGSSLLTAVAVTTAGTVGFVGLVVPHLVRLLGGADHRFVLPASALAGGTLLVLADTLARTVLAHRGNCPSAHITAIDREYQSVPAAAAIARNGLRTDQPRLWR